MLQIFGHTTLTTNWTLDPDLSRHKAALQCPVGIASIYFLISCTCLFCMVLKKAQISTALKSAVKGNQNQFRNLFPPDQTITGNSYCVSLEVFIVLLLEQTISKHRLPSHYSYIKTIKVDQLGENTCPAKSVLPYENAIFLWSGVNHPHTPITPSSDAPAGVKGWSSVGDKYIEALQYSLW